MRGIGNKDRRCCRSRRCVASAGGNRLRLVFAIPMATSRRSSMRALSGSGGPEPAWLRASFMQCFCDGLDQLVADDRVAVPTGELPKREYSRVLGIGASGGSTFQAGYVSNSQRELKVTCRRRVLGQNPDHGS